MCQITPNELLEYARNFLSENYGLELTVPLVINGRLKTTYGRFKYQRKRSTGELREVSVELNKTFIIHNSKEDVLNVLRHELIHFACFKMNKPFSDGDMFFESELKKHSTYSQYNIGEIGYKMKSRYKKFYTYECGCGEDVTTINVSRSLYTCKICRKRLIVKQVEQKLV